MTTSRSDGRHDGPPAPAGSPWPWAIAEALAAQEVQLPSGHAATLYDVLLEAAEGVMVPDAGTDPEAVHEGEPTEDVPSGRRPRAIARAASESGAARRPRAVPARGRRPRRGGGGLRGRGRRLRLALRHLALPALGANGWAPTEVVVALSDREVPFGQPDPEAVQFFEGFRIEDGACIAQAF